MKTFFLKNVASSLFICACVLFAVSAPISCKMTEEGIEIDPGDLSAPSIVFFSVSSNRSVQIRCSERFFVSELALSDDEAQIQVGIGDGSVSFNQSGDSAEIGFPFDTEIGKKYTLSGIISDSSGNSLGFSKSFLGYNDNPAKMVLREVRCAYSKNTKSVLNSRADFLEFKVLKGGNLAGTEVHFGYSGKKYAFPSITVSKDEILVLHLKAFGSESDGFVDERGSDLSEATCFESNANARDLWIFDTASYLSKTCDVVAIVDSYTNTATDGLLLSLPEKKWSRNSQKTLAKLLKDSGVWNGDTPETAASSEGASATKSIERKRLDSFPACKDDWFVTEKSTPGE